MKRGFLTTLLVGAAFLSSGCLAHRMHHMRQHADGTEVVVHRTHMHTDSCGHYQHKGRWYFLRGHRHGQRCGHTFVGGNWVIK